MLDILLFFFVLYLDETCRIGRDRVNCISILPRVGLPLGNDILTYGTLTILRNTHHSSAKWTLYYVGIAHFILL